MVTSLCAEINSDQVSHLAGQSSWDPFLFIDLVEKAFNTESETEHFCQKMQQLEWELLFDYSYTMACHQSE
jgi:hypothetical protein